MLLVLTTAPRPLLLCAALEVLHHKHYGHKKRRQMPPLLVIFSYYPHCLNLVFNASPLNCAFNASRSFTFKVVEFLIDAVP